MCVCPLIRNKWWEWQLNDVASLFCLILKCKLDEMINCYWKKIGKHNVLIRMALVLLQTYCKCSRLTHPASGELWSPC